jgi:hypothetical protein
MATCVEVGLRDVEVAARLTRDDHHVDVVGDGAATIIEQHLGVPAERRSELLAAVATAREHHHPAAGR